MNDFCRILNISTEEISNQTDIEILKEWRATLLENIKSIKTKIQELEYIYNQNPTKENFVACVRARDARKHNTPYLVLLEQQIKKARDKIKKENGVHGKNFVIGLMCFKDAAKELLSEEIYQQIKEAAQERQKLTIDKLKYK